MHHNYYLSPLAVALALGLSSQSQAVKPLNLEKLSLFQLKNSFSIASSTSASTDNLQFLKEHTDKNKITHIRLQQQYLGFPVYGGYAIVHSKATVNNLAASKDNARMNGTVYQGIQAELGQPEANFVAHGAQALAHFKAQFGAEELHEEQVTPMVYIDENQQAHWAYRVSALVVYKDKIPARPTAIVDAATYEPWIQWNNIKTNRTPAKGFGYGGNSKMGVYQYDGNGLPNLELTRNANTNECFMENNDVKVVDMEHKYTSKNKAMVLDCLENDSGVYLTGYKADGYDKINGAASPTNDALYAGYVIKHMYHDWYGVEALKKSDGTPMQLVMRVHYGDGYENAYWDGRQMTFGDGDTMMYPLVSLGVGAHEISHGFTEQHSDLEYYSQSGGMNESFSDMAAIAAEFYSIGKSDWMIGGEIMKEDSGYEALRYLDKPSRDGESIDSADEYYSGLDVHYSSGVYSHLYYIMAHMPNWDARKAFDVMVKANMDYWTPYSNFIQGGCGVLSATKDLGYNIEEVQSALKQVAINYSSCSNS